MKKIIALATAATLGAGTLFSGTALAGPGHKHGHRHGPHHGLYRVQYQNHDFVKGLAAFAILAGTAIAIDAALDDYEEDHHNHVSKPPKPRPQAGTQGRPLSERKFTINERQNIQHKRINKGVKSGELTRKEAKRLRKQQANIAGQEHNFRSSGKFTKKERKIIHARLDNASKDIYRLKHNDRYR